MLEQLHSLILEVENQGGKVIDGKIILPKKKLWVSESYFYAESQYENSGRYRVIRQIRELDTELVEQLQGLKGCSSEELKEFFIEYYTTCEDLLSIGLDCVEFGMGCMEEDYINYITNDDDEYDGNLLLEVQVSSDYGSWKGYMSFFEMDYADFERFEQIDLGFTKCLTYN